MGDVAPGSQARLHNLGSDASVSGKACVVVRTGNGSATVRLSTGRELVVPLGNLDVLAAPGRLPPQTRVALTGLSKAPALNGRFGHVAPSLGCTEGRLLVDLGDGPPKALKYENLVLVDPEAFERAPAPGDDDGRGTKVTIRNFVDPGINGSSGIVLGKDVNDAARLVVWLPSVGRAMTFRPEHISGSGQAASPAELVACREPLREAFLTEVRKLLWGLPEERGRLAELVPLKQAAGNPWAPAARVLAAWRAFEGACGRDAPGLFTVLRARPDLFDITKEMSGHEVVALTEAGRKLSVDEGLPEPPTKRRKVAADAGRQAMDEVARTLFSALRLCAPGEDGVPLSKLGSDVRVAQLRKDPRFRKLKLLDVIREYPQVFQLLVEPPPGTGWLVSAAEGAEAALPQRVAGEAAPSGAGDVLPDPEALRLPEKLENPKDLGEALQALRIEIVHALFRREGLAEIQQLGQEPGVQRARRELPKAKGLLELVKVFPDNFTVALDPEVGTHQIQLNSMDVEDMLPVEEWLSKRKGL